MSSNRVLPDEPWLGLQRNVIRAVGGHDLAAFVQQVHYIAVGPHGRDHDGYRWAVRTAAEWCTDVVLTEKQLKRVVAALVELGVIIRHQPARTLDRTAWTRIDYDRLDALISADASVPNGTDEKAQTVLMTSVPNGTDDPSTKTPKTEELRLLPPSDEPMPVRTAAQEAQLMLDEYWAWVKKQTGRHPVSLRPQQFKALVTPFLEVGIAPDIVRHAVGDMYRRGETLTRAGLERHIDGRARQTRQDAAQDRARQLHALATAGDGQRPRSILRGEVDLSVIDVSSDQPR